MNIGELFVTLGAKTDSSWVDGMNKLKGMGTAAKQAASVASRAMGEFKHALKNASFDAKTAADKVIDASKRQAAAVESSAKRQIAAHHMVARSNLEAQRVVNGIKAVKPSAINWGGAGNPFNPSGQKAAMLEAAENARLMQHKANRRDDPGRVAMGSLKANLKGFWGQETFGEGENAPGVSWSQFRRNAPARAGTVMQGDSNPNFIGASRGGGMMKAYQPGSGGGMFGNGDGAPPKGGRRGGAAGGSGRGRGSSGFGRFGALGDVSSFRRVILGAGIYQGLQSAGQLADVYLNLRNRIGGVTSSQEEANSTFERLYGIANHTRSSIESTAEGYVRMKNATEGMNLSADDQYKLIERVNMALATSGATASEARSGMMQLTQALAKGHLDGDEFKSLAENMPNILKILQKSLGKTEGQIRAMAKAGELTREKIVKALLGAGGIEEAFDKSNATFGQTYELFKNKLTKAFGELAEDKELVKAFGEAMNALADIIIILANAIGKVIEVVGPFVKALKDGEPWAIALAVALGGLATAWWAIARAATAAAAAQAAAAGTGGGKLGGLAGAANSTVGKAGGKIAKGLGAASGVAMYASSQGNDTSGVLGRIGGGAVAGGSLAGPWGALAGTLAAVVGEAFRDNPMDEALKESLKEQFAGKGVFDSFGSFSALQEKMATSSSSNVTIGTINITAANIEDASRQTMEKSLRHAAATVNRPGS